MAKNKGITGLKVTGITLLIIIMLSSFFEATKNIVLWIPQKIGIESLIGQQLFVGFTIFVILTFILRRKLIKVFEKFRP